MAVNQLHSEFNRLEISIDRMFNEFQARFLTDAKRLFEKAFDKKIELPNDISQSCNKSDVSSMVAGFTDLSEEQVLDQMSFALPISGVEKIEKIVSIEKVPSDVIVDEKVTDTENTTSKELKFKILLDISCELEIQSAMIHNEYEVFTVETNTMKSMKLIMENDRIQSSFTKSITERNKKLKSTDWRIWNWTRKKMVLLGTGWAGMSFLKSLNNPIYKVKVVSRNFFVFTPLLPSVKYGKVEAHSIVELIHNIIRKKNVDIRVSEAEYVKINPQNKKIYCRVTIDSHSKGQEEFTVDYDYLIIAVGAQVITFNTPSVMENCHFLKEIDNAQKIHENVTESFEKACLLSFSDKERKKILHFVIVGSGLASVEFAAELHDFVKEDVVQLYPKVKDLVKITLLEATNHILNMFDKKIINVAENKFGREGIDVKFGSMVTGISENEISTKIRENGKTTFTPYGMVLWSTSIELCSLIKEFMRQISQGNRRALATDEWLRVEGINNVYALGNYATINQRKVMEKAFSEVNSQMKNLPTTTQVAKQVVHIVFVKEILKQGVSYEHDGKGQKGEPIIYFAWKMIVEDAEDGQGVVENGCEWILKHDNAIVIISWRKMCLSMLGAYGWSENNPLPPKAWLCPCFLLFHPGKIWCHCRMVYSKINFFAPMSRYASGGAVGTSREFKDMVKALYGAGIKEILDIIYNHFNEADDKHLYTTSFLGIDNKVYYMVDLNNKAQLLNFSGCGNTLNCNHLVVMKLVLDSLRHWSVEYHIDGFRGDSYCGHSVLNKFKRA